MPDVTTTSTPTQTGGGFQDFLTEGAKIPAGSAVKSLTSQTVLPEWYTNYAMNILANQQATGGTPYQPYQGPRIAGFTPTQQQGFDMTKTAAGAYQPAMNQAMRGATQAMGMPTGMSAASPWLSQAGNTNPLATAQPYFNDAMSVADHSLTSGGGLAAAQPYLNASFGPTTDVSAYMDPYIGSVVNRIGDLGARTLHEKLLPEIRDKFISAGQWDSSGQSTDTARALRDINADVLAQQSQLLSSGYNQAVQAALADKARYGQLGATAGSFADNLMRAGIDVAWLLSNIGSQMGGLDLSRAQLLAGLGSTYGSLANADKGQAIAGSQALANLGGLAQSYGLTGAGAVNQIGGLEQAMNQKNLDLAYEDYLKQQGWGQAQIDAMLNTFKGVATGVPSATQEYGVVPSGVQPEYKPSTASSIASGLTGAAGLLKMFQGK